MTVPSEIDAEAPVLAHHEVEIQATLDEVWRLHTDVNAWTTWQSDIATASIEGAFEAGAPVEEDATNMQSLLDASLVSWLDHMKKAAESRA
jgi:hypothetical protein